MRALSVAGILRNGFATGFKNALSLVGAVLLWALTCWIPYLNVGTTIGLLGLIAAMSKGEVISPTAIFRAEYRKQMGEFFLVVAFMAVGIFIGSVFLVIPGIVIGLSWSLAPLLVIDKSLNPTEALQRSNDLTAGRKWTIFLGRFVTSLTLLAAVALLAVLGSKLHAVVGALLFFVGYVLLFATNMGTQAYVYGVLTESRPASPSDHGSPALAWGAFGGAVVALALAALVSTLGGHAPERLAEDFDVDAARSARAKAAFDEPEAELGEGESAAEPVQIQAPMLAAEFLKSAPKATHAYDGQSLEVSGVVKALEVSPLMTRVDFEVPAVDGSFNRLSALLPAKVKLRKGQKATIRGVAAVIDDEGITVTLMDAELVTTGKAAAGVRR